VRAPLLLDRRRPAFPRPFLIRAAIAWAMVSALLLLINASGIAAGRFPDPDDAMRLVQVRDLIAGQGWFNLTQARVDAAHGGVAMHWSRLVDVPLVVVIAALTPLLGTALAETAALVIVPLLTLGCAIVLTMRIAWRLLGDEEANLSAVVMAVSVPVLFQLGPMRIDHHGWQIVCALAAMNGLLARSPIMGGRIIGAALATWLAISIEGLPLAAAFCALLALRWLRRREARIWLLGTMRTLAGVSIGLFVITRGMGEWATWCDAISPLHLAMFAWGALVLGVLARWEPVPLAVQLGAFGLAAGGALAMLLASAPHCVTGGGFAGIDPLVERYWLSQIKEGLPIWHQSPAVMLQYAVTPLIGLGGAIMLARRSHDWLRQYWTDYALILAAALVTALFVARAGAVACVLAAPPMAFLLSRWLARIRQFEAPLARVAGMIALACALLPVLPLSLLTAAIPAEASRTGVPVAALPGDTAARCDTPAALAPLRNLAPGRVYAPLDIAPQILLATRHSVLATSHHRGQGAIRTLIAAALGPEARARAALHANGITYVALCTNLGEPQLYAAQAPQGFMAQLLADKPPAWLEPVPLPQGTTLRLWRVRQAGMPSPPR
jgi:hypothetical protein